MYLPNEEKQKFHRGDVVKISDLPNSMSHFPGKGELAIVEYSDIDFCGEYNYGDPNIEYSLFIIKEGSSHAWYPERCLTLIKRHGMEIFNGNPQITSNQKM